MKSIQSLLDRYPVSSIPFDLAVNNKEIAITKTFSWKSGDKFMAITKINENYLIST